MRAFNAPKNVKKRYGFEKLSQQNLGVNSWTQFILCQLKNISRNSVDNLNYLLALRLFKYKIFISWRLLLGPFGKGMIRKTTVRPAAPWSCRCCRGRPFRLLAGWPRRRAFRCGRENSGTRGGWRPAAGLLPLRHRLRMFRRRREPGSRWRKAVTRRGGISWTDSL